MEHFLQAFREEADELLAELEISLLELEQNPADEELIDRVFRVMHTLKGSSAMFGLDDIAALSHEVETVLDGVRDGGLPVTREVIRLNLLARDQIRAMLDVSAGGGRADAAQTEALVDALRELAGAAAAANSTGEPVVPAGPDAATVYLVRFRPEPEIFKRGLDPAQFLRELRDLGRCRITVRTDQLPPLAELDPELCYLSWEVELTTRHGVDAIHDVFIFIGEEGSVEIKAVSALAAADAAPASAAGPAQTPCPATKQEPAAISSIRVPAGKLDLLVNLVGELVTAQARLSRTAFASDDEGLIALAEEIERLTTGLRDTTLDIRMIPIGATFSRLRRLVHDLSHEFGKEIDFVTEGAETELDKTVIERIADPLLHLIRNSVDHGLEPPEVRLAAGKPARGTIRLSATHSGDSVLLSLSDDGAGMDRASLRAKGVERGLVAADAELADREILQLIFAPGFSTSAEVTSISGRGVGMDVVKRGVEALRGTIGVTSREGEGTTVTLRIPLTLAIIESLLVRIGDDYFVLPQALVEECIELRRPDIARFHGRPLVKVRGAIVPYIQLRNRFGIGGARPDIEQVVIVDVDGNRIGFVVDQVIGEHQTVIKPLGQAFRNLQGISGATILGDGNVALILDAGQLVAAEETWERDRGDELGTGQSGRDTDSQKTIREKHDADA